MSEPKAKILKAATELLIDGGLSALSVRAISSRAGLSTIGIYSHFKGKQGILDALYIEGFDMVSQAVSFEPENRSAKENVLLGALHYLQIAQEYDAHYRLIFGESDGSYQPSSEAKEAGAKAFARLTKLVSKLLPNDASLKAKQEAAMQVWALTHGYVSLHHHLVSDMVDMQDWQQHVLQALGMMLDAMQEGQEGQ